MTDKELEQFIEDVHCFMTLTEIEEYTMCPKSQVRRIVNRRCFKVITSGRRALNYIQKHRHMSFNELLEKLELTENNLYRYLKGIGITVGSKQRDIPLNELGKEPIKVCKPKPPIVSGRITKADVINDFNNKYNKTITWQDLTGNTGTVWSSY